jgi:hypothetical protein
MTTAQCFHVPEMRAMDLRSHDCNEKRLYQHLRHLCRVDGSISNLTALHLTFQCSEQVLIKVLKYLIPLQKLVLSITHPSPLWQSFLKSLTAKPSTNEWPVWRSRMYTHLEWTLWCLSQTWHVNVLPHLKYLGIHRPKGFSESDCLDNLPLFRLVGWTRARLTPPLEHLKVWEGRGGMDDTAVDYISTGYQDKHSGISSKEDDAVVVMGMATRCLIIPDYATPLLQLHSTVLFRQLGHLELTCNRNDEILILPYLEQIKKLEIGGGIIHEYSLNIDLPLTHTLQCLKLRRSTCSWMLGRTFKTLKEFQIDSSPLAPENLSRHEAPQVGLPACTTLELVYCPMDHLRFLSCSNVQTLRWSQSSDWTILDLSVLNSSHGFEFDLVCLQKFHISVPHILGLDSLIQFVFCDAWEQGVWRDIRSVEVEVWFESFSEASDFFNQTVAHQQRYEEWWEAFRVTKKFGRWFFVHVNASM